LNIEDLDILATRRYPVDYDSLDKGSILGAEQIGEIVQARPRTYDFSYRLAALSKQIQDDLWARGKPWTVMTRKGCIHILDDASAVKYNALRFLRHRRGLGQMHKQLVAVDVSKLDPDQRNHYDRAIRLQGTTLAAVIAAHKNVHAQPVIRQTPMLPGAGE
jgi:hypothetical protein